MELGRASTRYLDVSEGWARFDGMGNHLPNLHAQHDSYHFSPWSRLRGPCPKHTVLFVYD